VSQAGINAKMPNNTLWTDWNTHRLDWLPNISRYFVNGIETGSNTYGVPNHASSFILNVWSDGNKNWSGTFQDGAAAYLEVQWVEMIFNTTDTVSKNSCKTVCAVDGVKTIGSPEQVSTSTGGRDFPSTRSSVSCLIVAFCLIQFLM
jgi:beta-glucanase (GH16 family)